MPTWDDAQYRKFIDARTRPAAELLARVPLPAAERVLDLGCGPGNSTELLVRRWPNARVTGVDNSPEMLKAARAALPQLEFVLADVAQFRPEAEVDVNFSNATLQWLPDHPRLLPQLLECVRPGGVLAIQVPYNYEEPSHRAMREVAREFGLDPAQVRAFPALLAVEAYYDLLAPRCQGFDLWQTRYEQVMADPAAIVEWVKGTGFRPYLEAISAEQREAFLERYTELIAAAYPARADGKRLFSFPRLFMVGVRS
jgi:trans-aconitate 2-methyltransferase